MKKKYIIIIVALLVVIGFLNIKIAYNFSSPSPILDLETLTQMPNPSSWKYINLSADYRGNFSILYLEILLSVVIFILTVFIKNSKYILYSSILLLIVWLKNMILFKGIIEQDIYLSSSILFLVSLLVLNILNFYYKEKSIE
ncbi:hypothetical protein K0U91_12290 [Chryseobacterium chendengshani]|uniref:hypothetical protein n=1 Tax=Chryseobacterium sp. LJ668 TaxID=2864040 RepID=UPI001C68897B|nr:hypothetical protein [Chryseobacterium sp. LJ668]MBW8523549.1 hypothetical protein [Chryseobacterium sp. LJ668]QYK15832.1 hypothetical protein K0U91_12290 [Chryseobacterium sp. LJ668]